MSEENAAPQVPLTARSGAENDAVVIEERNAHSAFSPAVAAFCEPSRGTMISRPKPAPKWKPFDRALTKSERAYLYRLEKVVKPTSYWPFPQARLSDAR